VFGFDESAIHAAKSSTSVIPFSSRFRRATDRGRKHLSASVRAARPFSGGRFSVRRPGRIEEVAAGRLLRIETGNLAPSPG
jgi:hypothetical protein